MSNFTPINGSNYFRLNIAYSILLLKPITISGIREDSMNPGLTNYEINYLKLVSQITNGTKVKIDSTGTILHFTPGVITNNYGEEFDFDCGNERNITYFLEGILLFILFGKEPLKCNLSGITNDSTDISVDTFKDVTCKLLQKIVVGEESIKLQIMKRGLLPIGNGLVKFYCTIITFINPFEWQDEGKIKRIRGTAFTSKVSQSISTRLIDACRGVFNNFIPDVWIYVDNYKNKTEEISPGYGLSLVAETTNDYHIASELSIEANDVRENGGMVPEDFSRKVCLQLLDEVYYCGAVDTHHQSLSLYLMALGLSNGISKVKLGRVSNYTVGFVRRLKTLFGVKFKIVEAEANDYDDEIEEEEEEDYDEDDFDENLGNGDGVEEFMMDKEKKELPKRLIFACVGIGLKNVARIEN